MLMGFPEYVDAAQTLSNSAQCQTGCTRQSSPPRPHIFVLNVKCSFTIAGVSRLVGVSFVSFDVTIMC